MQQGHFRPIALKQLLVQMNGVKMACDISSITEYSTADVIRQALIYKSLKAGLWLFRFL